MPEKVQKKRNKRNSSKSLPRKRKNIKQNEVTQKQGKIKIKLPPSRFKSKSSQKDKQSK